MFLSSGVKLTTSKTGNSISNGIRTTWAGGNARVEAQPGKTWVNFRHKTVSGLKKGHVDAMVKIKKYLNNAADKKIHETAGKSRWGNLC